MARLPIPPGVAAVTPEWLTEALGNALAPGVRVSSIDWKQIGQGVGFLGELSRVKLTYDGEAGPLAPSSVIVKLPTQMAEARGMAAVLGFYEREIGFYNEIGPEVGVRIPKSYHAVFEPATCDFALVMEDVQNAAPGDQLASCTLEQARLAVRVLARLHARWWQSPRLSEYAWLPTRGHAFYEVLKAGHRQNLPAFADVWASRFDPSVARCVIGLGEKYDEYLETIFRRPLTLTHSDYRLDNMMFGSAGSEDEFVLLDWQLCQASIGTLDLQYFISGNLRRDVIAKHTDELLDAYYDELRTSGVVDYSMAELRDDYARTSLMLGLYIVAGVAAIDPNNYDQRGNDLLDLLYGSLADSMVRYEAERFLPR